jgi:L-lactate dehydrogenase complex protein LldF
MSVNARHPLPVLERGGRVNHAAAAARFTADQPRTAWHDATLWYAREKRDRIAATVPEWETLRELASAIKEHTLSRLADYLEQFEAKAMVNGAKVHWARDAEEHNRIVLEIVSARGAKRLVKSKSMLTEECGLNPYLEAHGVEVVDTDLGERIVQLRGEPPSHIVAPAIHLKKQEIGETFHKHLGTPEGLEDPVLLAGAARTHLRARFLAAEVALTGVNFAVAETGSLIVCTNEGNADLGTSLAPVHIASLGIEKVIPRLDDLAVFLRLLARSATGQAMTVYTSHVQAPRMGQELHIVLVDNGRSVQLGREEFWRSLKCIRCGACLNTCPIYRRSGGHSYGTTVGGPIGAVLAPGIDLDRYAALPFASTLCGSCTAVCPVKVDLDAQLYRWRQRVTASGKATVTKAATMKAAAQVLSRPWLFWTLGAAARTMMRIFPRKLTRFASGVWGRSRDLPAVPRQSFHAWYRERQTRQAKGTVR